MIQSINVLVWALICNKIARLRRANEEVSKHKSHKRKYIQKEGVLMIGEALELVTLGSVNKENFGDVTSKWGLFNECLVKQRCYRNCGKPGHKVCTCQEYEETPFELDTIGTKSII